MSKENPHDLSHLGDSKIIMRGLAAIMLRLGAPAEDAPRYKAIRNELRERGAPDFCCHECFGGTTGESNREWK